MIVLPLAAVGFSRETPWVHLVLLFSSLHPIVEKIKDPVPGLLINAWYLDDGILCRTLDDLCALSITDAEGPSRGLFLNRCKSLLHAPANFSVSHPLLSGIPIRLYSSRLLAHAAVTPEWQSIQDIDVPLVQRYLPHAIDEASFVTLLGDAPDSHYRALGLWPSPLLSAMLDIYWLNVVHFSALGLHLQDWEFPLCLQYRLGLRMSVEGSSCPV